MRRQNTKPQTPTPAPLQVHKGSPSTSPPPSQPLPYPDAQRTASAGSYRGSSPHQNAASGYPPPNGSAPAPVQYTYPTAQYPAGYNRQSLAERRGTRFKALPDSPGPDTPDKDDPYASPLKSPGRLNTTNLAGPQGADAVLPSAITEVAYDYYGHQAPPKPGPALNTTTIHSPQPSGVNRLPSTASVSTTRGNRGSPPPPETPVNYAAGGIEARYAAAGIAGPSTLNSLQAQNLTAQAQSYASQQRNAQYSGPPRQETPRQEPPRRPWTPTEDSGTSSSHRPLSTFLGTDRESARSPPQANNASTPQALPGSPPRPQGSTPPPQAPPQHPLEQDLQTMQVSDEPPPAYESIGKTAQGYPQEKGSEPQQRDPQSILGAKAQARAQSQAQRQNQAQGLPTSENGQAVHPVHPAFSAQNGAPGLSQNGTPSQDVPEKTSTPDPSGKGKASPPPLPEGWIAHMDPGSGQYYYIHLPTQSTQWEFPKGPNPLNLAEPTSPTGTFVNPFASPAASTFQNPLASPGIQSMHSMMSPTFGPSHIQRADSFGMQSVSSPTAAGFSQLPPMSGVEQYRVAPTNGVYFGPYLRYTNMDVDNGVWFGSLMIVTDSPHPPTIHLHQSQDMSPDPRQLKANHIHQHRRFSFYRYDIDIHMDAQETKWTYALTSHLGCTRYEFLIAGRNESNWRFIAHSGNDFAINVNANERTKIGGVGYMWKDILQKHGEVGGFHAQLGLGNQIFADRLWKEIPLLRQWTATSGKDNRKTAPWTPQHEEEVSHAFFHFYTSHLDQPLLREAFAQIPHILTLDDHDIFDGFGSYPSHLQQSQIVRNLSRIAYQNYLLFQHHTTPEILAHVRDNLDLFTITGTGFHFLKYLGPSVVVLGPDTRSERTQNQVLAGPTYQGLFPKIATLPPSVQHCLLLLPVPIVYPRLEAAEQFASAFGTGKKVATGTFNALGKVAGGVAGIVGAKGVVREGFDGVKKAVGKSGLMSNVLSPFGEVDMLDELRDQWTHESKVSLPSSLPLQSPSFVPPGQHPSSPPFAKTRLIANPGPRAHLPNPHPPIHRPHQKLTHHLPFRRHKLHRHRPPPRPHLPPEPQDNVPDHLLLRRQRPALPVRIADAPPALKHPAALHPRQRD